MSEAKRLLGDLESRIREAINNARQHVKVLNELRVVLAELCGVLSLS